jgi:hypothetical protein
MHQSLIYFSDEHDVATSHTGRESFERQVPILLAYCLGEDSRR